MVCGVCQQKVAEQDDKLVINFSAKNQVCIHKSCALAWASRFRAFLFDKDRRPR